MTTTRAKTRDELKLGKNVAIPDTPHPDTLDAVAAPGNGVYYAVRNACPEFVSLCPATGAPDFATIVIDYVPNELLVESKSLKLYLQSYRNHKSFHEACTVAIATDLVLTIDPVFIRVSAFFMPRGGISIDCFWQAGEVPKGVYLPDPGVGTWRGRF